MRELPPELKAAQEAMVIDPLVKIVLTHGASSYTYDRDRILDRNHPEEPYSQKATVVLDNSDGALTNLALQGYKGVISYGAITGAGEEYSACAPLWVIGQQLESSPGKLDCTLELIGIMNLMAEDKASAKYMPDETDTKTVKTLINEILGATLACYSHCDAVQVKWETGYDTLADTYKPKDTFRIYAGGSRLAAFRRLLDYTGNVARAEADGKVHIFKPITSGVVYDSEYSLESGHTFFSKAYRKRVVIPGYIVVKSQPDDVPQYSGFAKDPGYDALPAKLKKQDFKQMRLESSDPQANDIAAAILSKHQLWSEMGAADVPMNVGAEVFDYVKVAALCAEDVYRVGNLGHLTRHYNAERGEWRMTFSFGNWMTVRKALANLDPTGSIGTDELEEYFSRLQVKDLYAENILAENMAFVWIDPDNNIDLSKIGDNLDNLPDGEVFARVKTLHLSAEGGIKLDEHILYKAGYDPDTKRRNFTSTPTTPYDSGDMWTDGTVLKRCTTARATGAYVAGDWTQVSIDEIKDGSIYQRAKSAALTPDGLVILDQVYVDTEAGEYGLVKRTGISAGKILLSESTPDDDHLLTSTTEKTTWNGKEIAIKRGTTAPADKTKLWLDTSTTPYVWKRWSGAAWVKATPTKADEIAETAYLKWAAEHGADVTAGKPLSVLTNRTLEFIADSTYRKSVTGNEKIGASDAYDVFESKLTAYGLSLWTANSTTRVQLTAAGLKGYSGGVLQVEIRASDGKIYAGGGNVIIGAGGIEIRGATQLKFTYGGSYAAYIYVASSRNLVISPSTGYFLETTTDFKTKNVRPDTHESRACGYSDNAWSQVCTKYLYTKSTSWVSYQKHDDIALLKAIKSKKEKGKDIIDIQTLPKELVIDNDYVNVAGMHGLNIGVMKALLARIEALEAKKTDI